VSPVDRSYATSYQSAIVIVAYRVSFSRYLTLNKIHDPEILVTGHSRSLEMALFDRWHTSSYWPFMATMALCCIMR